MQNMPSHHIQIQCVIEKMRTLNEALNIHMAVLSF